MDMEEAFLSFWCSVQKLDCIFVLEILYCTKVLIPQPQVGNVYNCFGDHDHQKFLVGSVICKCSLTL